MQADKLSRADSKRRVAEQHADEMRTELDTSRGRVAELEDRLRAMGVDLESKDGRIGDLTATLAERERALAEYRAKAKQLEEMKARFELLRQKLDGLTKIGVEVKFRKNRMIISLPGDVLFDTNKDQLKKDGREALGKIAEVLRSDPSLATRDYQVAGHTDDKAVRGGPFGDNLGLSVARARSVLGFLVDPKGGQLPRDHWSASGFADTDPVGPNDTDSGRQANRRCELVVMPAMGELLDLRELATGKR